MDDRVPGAEVLESANREADVGIFMTLNLETQNARPFETGAKFA